jgi:hypothetical protein
MSAAKPASPLTLATARIVHETGIGDTEEVIDGALVAKVMHAIEDAEGLFDPENIARQVGNAACVLKLRADRGDEDTPGALYFLAEALSSIARRLDVMPLDRASRYRIELAEAAS